MADASNADTKWSEKKMEGDQDSMRTVDCLRGRLLAERSASRSAAEKADILAEKLKELENKLKVELKARVKAENKLNLLKKKLESLGISYFMDESGVHSSPSENSESSCISSAEQEEEHQFQGSDSCVEQGHEVPLVEASNMGEKLDVEQLGYVDSRAPSDETLKSGNYCGDSDASGPLTEELSRQILETCDKSVDSGVHYSGMKPSIESEINKDEEENVEENNDEEDYHVDDAMALVPVSMLTDSGVPSSREMMIKVPSQSAREVLDTLRQLREVLECSVQRRHIMIRVG